MDTFIIYGHIKQIDKGLNFFFFIHLMIALWGRWQVSFSQEAFIFLHLSFWVVSFFFSWELIKIYIKKKFYAVCTKQSLAHSALINRQLGSCTIFNWINITLNLFIYDCIFSKVNLQFIDAQSGSSNEDYLMANMAWNMTKLYMN